MMSSFTSGFGAYRRAFHRRLHHARTAAGADIQLAQAQLGADVAAVLVLHRVDGVAAPADDGIRVFPNVQRAGVAQNRENLVSDMRRIIRRRLFHAGDRQLAVNKQNIAQHGKQVGLQRTDNASVDKRLFRRIDQFQLDAALAAQHVDVEIFKAGKQFVAAVGLAA